MNDQLNSLCFTVEMVTEVQVTTMACPSVMSTSNTLSIALLAMSMVAALGSAPIHSGHLTMDRAIITNQQFPYMPVSIPFYDHGNMSTMGFYGGLGGSVTPFLVLYMHPVSW